MQLANDNEPAINFRDRAVLDVNHEPVNLDVYFAATACGGWNAGRLRQKPRVIINPSGDEERERIAGRQAKGAGWDGRLANDNDYWPLLKALRDQRDALPDKERLTMAAIAYREIEAIANNSNPLAGTAVDDGCYQLDQRTWVNRDGKLVYKGLRIVDTGEPIPSTQARRATIDDDGVQVGGGKARIAVKWEGDAGLIAMIDAKRLLRMLREELGPLQQPLEDAVVFSRSLTDIGLDEGATNTTTGSGMGKGLVYRGLRAIAGVIEKLALSKSACRAV